MGWKQTLIKALGERTYNQVFYYYLHLKTRQVPKVLDLKRPTTFNEKTIWLKIHHRYENAGLLADKVRVKDYVAGKIGEQYIIPTIAIYDRASDIDFDALPSAFVLKANHGSAWNIICPDKTKLDIAGARVKLASWLGSNYYDQGKEYQYRHIEPKIICEKFLVGTPGNALVDFKIFCFSGEPAYVQVDLDRFTNHTRNFYDLDWNLVPFTTLYPLGQRITQRPEALDEMLGIARVLSEGMKFARIDLYHHEGKVYFGEITLHHGGGFEPFIPPEYDRKLGDLIKL